jgi:peptidoglycan/LPS O-acetylase OafA/YrhL
MSMSPLRTNLCLPEARMAADDGTIPCLDGLRAVSIALVVCTHFVTNEIPGGLGVTTFFFISGFLIARLLFAEWKSTGRIDLRAFYIRRFLRLYPVIVAYGIFTIAVALWLRAPIKTVEITSVLFYFANYLYAANQLAGETFVHPIGPFWSLSVEEHFYFFAPLLFIVARSDSTRLLRIFAGICAACLALRFVYTAIWPQIIGLEITYVRSETRFDSIAYGVLLAIACESAAGRRFVKGLAKPAAFWLAALALAATLLWRDPLFRDTLRYSVQGMALFVLVSTVVFTTRIGLANVILNTSVAVWIGRLSYSIYVWHVLVDHFMPHSIPAVVRTILLFVITLAVACASYYLIERPFLRLRKRFRATPERGKMHPVTSPALTVSAELSEALGGTPVHQ